jgi:hypothetical protein
MGMYDIIILDVKCPRCGKKELRECQTHDLDDDMMRYEKGDYISDQFNYLHCITSCNCTEKAGKEFHFNLRIYLVDGVITEVYSYIRNRDK